MEIVGVLCDCEFDDNFIFSKDICIHCIKRKDTKRIREYYKELSDEPSLDKQLIIIKNLFEYILINQTLVLTYPNFKKVIIEKINEFLNDNRTKPIKDTLIKAKIILSHK